MSTLPPADPRFIPTLTEVVAPTALTIGLARERPTDEALIRALTQQMSGLIEQRLVESCEVLIRNLLSEHVPRMLASLKIELESTVRDIVTKPASSMENENKQK